MTRDLPPTDSFPSSSSSDRRSRAREYVQRRRCWLSALAVLLVAVMVVGIIFAAHKYYHDLGGQGFLKTRRGLQMGSASNVYLPLRKVEIRDDDNESFLVYGAGFIRRSGQNVPFYVCGDQQHNCEAFGQPVS